MPLLTDRDVAYVCGVVQGDWCPAVGQASVSTLLNSHHVILDFDAVVDLLNLAGQDKQVGAERQQQGWMTEPLPSKQEIKHWTETARSSFVKAFLHNITAPGTAPLSTCGSVPESHTLLLGCRSNQTIANVTFAAYGVPAGSCTAGFLSNHSCFLDIRKQVSAMCVGKAECSVECEPHPPGKRICAGVDVHDPCEGVHKHLSVSIQCSAGGSSTLLEANRETMSVADDRGSAVATLGPAFSDPHPLHYGAGSQEQTEAASSLAAMEAAPKSLINDDLRVQLGNTLVALVQNHNHSLAKKVDITGGIIDMAHLVPQLILHGHPDVGFDVLAAEGPATYYNM
eukprot:COSAG02_NODE_2996_length_7581_cov_35.324111_5_plen_340_part_00